MEGYPHLPELDQKPLTQKEIDAYLEHGWAGCPKCKADDVQGGPVEIDCNNAWQDNTCMECGYHWNDIYTLTGAEAIT